MTDIPSTGTLAQTDIFELSTLAYNTNSQGIRIATATQPYFKGAAIGIYIPVGSRHETPQLNGAAHFIEHLLFKGTPEHSAIDLLKFSEQLGADIDAYTTQEYTGLETFGPHDNLKPLLNTLMQMAWCSLFPADEIDKEREVILEEITLGQENPSDYLDELLAESLWTPHALGRGIAGSAESVNGLTRESLMNFWQEHYFSQDNLIIISSPYSHEQICDIVNQQLTKLKLNFNGHINTEPFKATHAAKTAHQYKPNLEQTHIGIGIPTMSYRSEDTTTLTLLNLILGSSMSSRLFVELREKQGLCYHIASHLSLYQDVGALEVTMGCDLSKVAQSKASLKYVFDSMISEPITADELQRAKDFHLGQVLKSLESSHAHLNWLSQHLLHKGNLISPEQYQEKINNVSLKQIHALSQTLFANTPHYNISLGS